MPVATRKQVILLFSLLSAGFLAVLGLVLVGIAMPGEHEYDSLIMSQLQACPAAVEALGAPMTNQLWGFGPGGSVRLRGAFGEVDWTDLVGGPKSRGYYRYVLEKRGGPWIILSAQLSVGEKQIDVLDCAKRAKPH